MCPSKVNVIILSVFLFISSALISKFIFFINVLDPDTNYTHRNISSKYKFIGNSDENVVWLLQISDLHISIFHDNSRISELKIFCNNTIDVIKPSVVLATGDLTDAKTPDGEGSTQYEQEWIVYRDILYHTEIPEKVLWLDIRGNHDNFDVLCVNSENNYFRKYSIQGPQHPRSYFYIYEMNNSEKIGFLGIDSCLEVGTRRPFNFVGQLTSTEMDTIRSYVQKARDMNVSYLFWFGHYPTSTIQYPESEKLRSLIANDETSVGYFCGHLHQIGGLVPNMYTFQKDGYFELELGDWRANRIIRIMAIDHGQFSFIDVKHGTWPIVLVTNPKPVVLVPPGGDLVIPSSHIRMLIFSPVPISNVELKIDDGEWQNCDNIRGPLYVSQWNQNHFWKGLHVISIKVSDSNGKIMIHEHTFSLDGTRIKTKFFARFFLMPNLGMMFYCFFTSSIFMCSAPLLICRYLVKRNKVNSAVLLKVQYKCLARWIRRLCSISYLDIFFYPLFLYPLYLLFGPWAVVYLVENKLGVIFSWGLIINNTIVPSWITYPFGWIQIILHTSLVFHLARQLDQRCYNIINKKSSFHVYTIKRCLKDLWENKYFIFVICLQLWDTYNFWLSYGHLTLIFCPFKIWWIIMAIWLKNQVHTIKKENLLNANRFWLSSQ